MGGWYEGTCIVYEYRPRCGAVHAVESRLPKGPPLAGIGRWLYYPE